MYIYATYIQYAGNALLKRSSMHLMEGDHCKAADDIQTSMFICPDNADAYVRRAQVYLCVYHNICNIYIYIYIYLFIS